MQKIWIVWIAVVVRELAAEPACSAERAAAGCAAGFPPRDDSKLFFNVRNTSISIEAISPKLTVECKNNSGRLDVAALPRFPQETEFEEIYVKSCALGNASVASVLGALRVRLEGGGRKLELSGLDEPLRAVHFAALDLVTLSLGKTNSNFTIRLEDDFFDTFPNLSRLATVNVQYSRPPSGLEKWSSTNAGLRRLEAGWVARLTELYLVEPLLTDVSALGAAARLRVASLAAPAGALPPLPALTSLSLWEWGAAAAPAWAAAALRELSVSRGALARPAPDWLAASTALRRLQLQGLPLEALPAGLLQGNAALRTLAVRDCNLTDRMLPDAFLADSEVQELDLSHNKLESIPSFVLRLKKLESLNLSFNRLVAPAAPLAALPSLRALRLDYNARLGDACRQRRVQDVFVTERSWLRWQPQLRVLWLRGVGATRLCPDWIYDMPELLLLNLADNLITSLSYEDLHPLRNETLRGRARIELSGNNVTRVHYDEDDLRRAAADKWSVTVKLSEPLECDCDAYWFARSMREHREHARVESPVCAGTQPRAMRDVPLHEFACAVPCAPRCACALQPALRGVRARCAALPDGLGAPRRDGLPLVSLSLAGAALRALPPAEALPASLRELDVRNNSIRGAAAGAARALLRGRRLRLAGNPLACACGQRALLDDLLPHKDRVDWDQLSCSEAGLSLEAECGPGVTLAALLGVLAALGALGALLLGALAHPKLRARLKTALRVFGVRVPAAADAAPREFDAFVSFAEADAQWVARELAPALEAAAPPRRLCLHYRDWAVGELIPRQITRSVRASRRTLLVVSDAFARSAWARAELDEALGVAAREARPPPVVVLRAAPSAASLAAAPALRDYLRAATYLRADDPRFVHKLRAAVPAGGAARY